MEKFILVQEKKIYCRIINEQFQAESKPLLVFLHEGLGTSEQWKDFPKLLSNKFSFPALMYDRYGYGKSQSISGQRQMNYMEEEARIFLPQILNEAGIKNQGVILFGHSDGGTIAAFYASFFPHNVLAAIIEAPHFFLDNISVQGIKDVHKAYHNTSLKAKLSRYHGENTESMFLTWTGILLSDKMQQWNAEHLLKNISCPVLAIQGTEDNFGTLKQIEAIRDNAQGKVELLVIDGCGHIPHHQARKKTFDATVSFLKSVLQEH